MPPDRNPARPAAFGASTTACTGPLECDFFKLTAVEGEGNGELLKQVPVSKGDYLLADRGYCTASGIHHVAVQGGFLTVRVNVQSLQIGGPGGGAFPLIERLEEVTKPTQIGCWSVEIPSPQAGQKALAGRLCVIRKSEEAIRLAHKKLRRKASKRGNKLQAETLLYAKYVIVFTTFAEEHFSAHAVLEWYRLRWQIELVFKRFKQIADLGHLPKQDPESAKAWLYGKLFVALLTEKLIATAKSISPWGYIVQSRRIPSPWREFSFAFRQVQQVVMPPLPLGDLLQNWREVAEGLAEPPRHRQLQSQRFENFSISTTS